MIRFIKLYNFRNYGREEAEFDKGVNIVIGRNGQGKTNLLEALFFFIYGRSMRTRDVKEMVKKGETEALVEGVVYTGVEVRARKTIVKEGTVRGKGETSELRAVCFQPDDIWMVKGGPDIRRRYINEAAVERKRVYRETIREYQRILRQRNEAIKAVRKERRSREGIRSWNPLLIQVGSELVKERVEIVESMQGEMRNIAGRWGMGKLDLRYYATIGKGAGEEEKDMQRLRKMEDAEIRRGATLLGPHRDELLFVLGGRGVRRECSQGEQKLVAIMWRLAQGRLIRDETGKETLMLLDDCLSELDEKNREAVMGEIEGWEQVVLTTTDDCDGFAGMHRIYLDRG